jgi:hypothetical protein
MPLPAYLTALGLDFDPAILQAKYKDEREKRLRPDGNEQYIDISTQPAFLVDPYTAAVPRAPSTEEIEVAVLGGGFGGLLQAVRLQQSGVEDFKIIEKAGSFGGTWRVCERAGTLEDCVNLLRSQLKVLESLVGCTSRNSGDLGLTTI